jgi:hypothetical protein
MDAAMWYVIDNGITSETTYPYKGRVIYFNNAESKMCIQNNPKGLWN